MTKNITDFVQSCIDDYKHFVDIDSFPSFDVKPKEMTLEKSLKQGFDAPAAAFYDIPTGNHTLEITLSVIANGRLLPNVTLKVKAQGISKNDDPFGGIGL